LIPVCWALKPSLAIRPAGSSLPVLIFKPVLRRCRLVFSELVFCCNERCAISELTLVFIVLIPVSLRDKDQRLLRSRDPVYYWGRTHVCRHGPKGPANPSFL